MKPFQQQSLLSALKHAKPAPTILSELKVVIRGVEGVELQISGLTADPRELIDSAIAAYSDRLQVPTESVHARLAYFNVA